MVIGVPQKVLLTKNPTGVLVHFRYSKLGNFSTILANMLRLVVNRQISNDLMPVNGGQVRSGMPLVHRKHVIFESVL